MRVVLQVEDNQGDIGLLRAAVSDAGVELELHAVATGAQAIAFLQRRGDQAFAPVPDLIVIDLGLPSMDGLSLLNHIKNHPQWRLIPVIVLSASRRPVDLDQARELGAARYVVKPDRFEQYVSLARKLEHLPDPTPRIGTPIISGG